MSQPCSVLHTKEFLDRYRRSPKDFGRGRILSLRKGVSLQGALDEFFTPNEEMTSFVHTLTKSTWAMSAGAACALWPLTVYGFRVPCWRDILHTFGCERLNRLLAGPGLLMPYLSK